MPTPVPVIFMSVRVPADLHERAKAEAHNAHMSLNKWVIELIAVQLEQKVR